MANGLMIYFFLIVLLSLFSNTRSAKSGGSSSGLVLPLLPPSRNRLEGNKVNPPGTFIDENGKPRDVTITKKHLKGENSTIGFEGETVHLSCNLVRDNSSTPSISTSYRYRVVWRINGEYKSPEDIEKYQDTRFSDYIETRNSTNITLQQVNVTDRGWYQCGLWDTQSPYCPQAKFSPTCIVAFYEIQLRVKDINNLYYPLISICVELLLLFIIILVYEKRTSKTDVEESDTDGSPDQ